MSPMNSVRRIEKGFPWGPVSLVVGIVIGIAGLYAAFHERKPGIIYEIVSEANVLDIRRQLQDLTITFQGNDIQEKNLNLRIYQIKISNSGEKDILQGDYDQKDIWGFRVLNGRIVGDIRLLNSNSDYLNRLAPNVLGNDTVRFEKLIFERNKFCTVELLVLHSTHRLPGITPIGKVAGIDNIKVVKLGEEKQEIPFWRSVFYGNAYVELARAMVHVVGAMALLIAVLFLRETISDQWRRARRIRREQTIERALKNLPGLPVEWSEFLKKSYTADPNNLTLLRDVFMDEGHVQTLVCLARDLRAHPDMSPGIPTSIPLHMGMVYALFDLGIVQGQQDGMPNINGAFMHALNSLLQRET